MKPIPYWHKRLSLPSPHYPPVHHTFRMSTGFFCTGTPIKGIIYPVVHGDSKNIISPDYEAEIRAQVGQLLEKRTVLIFHEGNLNKHCPTTTKPTFRLTDRRDPTFSTSPSDTSSLPLLPFFRFELAENVDTNLTYCKNVEKALGKTVKKKTLATVANDQASITLDSALMALRILDTLHRQGEPTDFLVLCGALHRPQIPYYLTHPKQLYAHLCQLFDRLDVGYKKIEGKVTPDSLSQFTDQKILVKAQSFLLRLST